MNQYDFEDMVNMTFDNKLARINFAQYRNRKFKKEKRKFYSIYMYKYLYLISWYLSNL